ncbi:putative regulator of Ras-like GTPase activity (Roadblock/LC7/MglB family) [Allocatelliglobosispora scoriae]|uniref:Putative regulator of Ras-like GTPase activity (Roadblock/LC7/MglB family) n=1 Tax=Allocatelliglobosispora scoriae TaxID=643052 RepID=A0A841BJ85_9ACTN|nr:roadblock/LC7 domain-containing protein [Allocatelliglobosispora scoriae]MBB5869177.1 putative regulator of Ras-like GTPase activity (Roadblock/LC7/MglB family) [Allocatelliglobosispora scoriae]
MATNTVSAPAAELHWMISAFAQKVPGVAHAAVVSSDGLPLSASAALPPERASQLAAVGAGLHAIAKAVIPHTDSFEVRQTVVEMSGGFVLVMQVADGSILMTLAAPDCDLGTIGFEMTRLVKQAGEMLTPDLRAELLAP